MTHRPSIIKSLHSLKSVTVTAPQYFLERKTRDGWDCDRSWESRCINHQNIVIGKSFKTVTVTVPLIIPMIGLWEIDPNFQVSIFTVANSTRTFPEGIHVTWFWYMLLETLILFRFGGIPYHRQPMIQLWITLKILRFSNSILAVVDEDFGFRVGCVNNYYLVVIKVVVK